MGKHAYLILAHNNFEQLKNLIGLLDDNRNDIFLFIDKKNSTNIDFKSIRMTVQHSGIEIYHEFNVNWGGYSLCKATLYLMSKAKEKDIYRYYHLISGADLPLHNQDYIHDFFNKYDGYEFLAFVGDEIYQKKDPKNRIKYYYLFQDMSIKNKLIKKIVDKMGRDFFRIQRRLGVDRIKNENLQIGYGTQWCSVTNELVDYLLEKRRYIERIFKRTLCCDEMFIHTLMLNSIFKDRLFVKEGLTDCKEDRQGSLRYINWWDGCPKTWTIEDKEELLEARNRGYLFSRKFNENLDNKIIDFVIDLVKEEANYSITDHL